MRDRRRAQYPSLAPPLDTLCAPTARPLPSAPTPRPILQPLRAPTKSCGGCAARAVRRAALAASTRLAPLDPNNHNNAAPPALSPHSSCAVSCRIRTLFAASPTRRQHGPHPPARPVHVRTRMLLPLGTTTAPTLTPCAPLFARTLARLDAAARGRCGLCGGRRGRCLRRLAADAACVRAVLSLCAGQARVARRREALLLSRRRVGVAHAR